MTSRHTSRITGGEEKSATDELAEWLFQRPFLLRLGTDHRMIQTTRKDDTVLLRDRGRDEEATRLEEK